MRRVIIVIAREPRPRAEVELSQPYRQHAMRIRTSAFREEVQSPTVERERGRPVECRAVDRGSDVHRRTPHIQCRTARGDPDVLAPETASSPGRDEHLEAV